MKRTCTLVVMSLVLLLGLWGYSMSMDSPYPRPSDPSVTVGPSDGDHPWGGDQGQGGGGTLSSVGTIRPHISTGNAVVDIVVNRFLLHGRILNHLFSTKTQTSNTGSTVKPNAPASGSTSAN